MILELKDPEGQTVWITGRWVTKVSVPPPGQYVAGTKALVWMGANIQAVQEEPIEVVKMLLEEIIK